MPLFDHLPVSARGFVAGAAPGSAPLAAAPVAAAPCGTLGRLELPEPTIRVAGIVPAGARGRVSGK